MDSFSAARDTSPPQASAESVWQIGFIGLAIAGVAGVGGAVLDILAQSPPEIVSGARNALAPLGILVAGCALSMRPNLVSAWLIFAGAALLGRFGFTSDWDSARLFVTVTAAVAVAGALMLWMPARYRYVAISGCVLFHFSGVLSAVTSPPPQPYLTTQLWTKVFRKYLHFTYMNNAYQFYSPDPGPASEVWFCIEYQPHRVPDLAADEQLPSYKRWIKIPRRPQDFRDPLGQTYYRRLALTEQLVSPGAVFSVGQREQADVAKLRQARLDVKYHPEIPLAQQYRPPTEQVRRYLLPAYVAHIARQYAQPGADVKAMKVYRVQHQLISAAQFAGRKELRLSPYDPTTYVPVYQGEYGPQGNLLDSKDPLLYWVVPIIAKAGKSDFSTTSRMNEYTAEDYKRYFDDYVNEHTGSDHRKDLLP